MFDNRVKRLENRGELQEKLRRRMHRTLNLDDRSFSVVEANVEESFCLVCDTILNVASSTNIFYTSLPRNGELLASFVLRVLRPVASDLRSSYICSRCSELFQMLEQAQWTVSNIRCEILKVYHSRESKKDSVRKLDLPGNQILPEECYIQSENKTALDGDFNEINEFRTLDVEGNENIARSNVFEESPNDFCTLNIEIVNSDKKIQESLEIRENNVYGSKIVCLKALNTERDENITRSDSFGDSPNDFCNLNIGIDNTDKKLKKPLEICQNSVYQRKIDCLKVLNTELNENVARSDSFDDSPNNFCNLNIGIDNSDAKLEKSITNRQDSIYERQEKCLETEESSEISKKREGDNKLENCSKKAEGLIEEISSNLLNNSIDGSSESLIKDDKKARYTMQCRMCPRLFKFARDLRSHYLKHGGSRPYQCRKCDERFVDLSLANSHATTMHSSKKNCITVATEPSNNELVDFTGEDSIILDESDKPEKSESNNKSTDRASWKSGGISKYSLKPLKYPCTTCGKKWRTSAELKTHVKSHSDLRPYMCEKCGQAYKHKHALEIHVGMHNGISPYQCSVCNKCFTQKGALMRHLPMHTGEMPYQCELCGKRFVHHTSYNMHALSHTGKKSYQCHVSNHSTELE